MDTMMLLFLLVLALHSCDGDILSKYDFNRLGGAVSEAFRDDGDLVKLIVGRMETLNDRLRRERSVHAFQDEGDDDEDALVDPPLDFHALDGVNLDFGDPESVALDSIRTLSTSRWDREVTDVDVVQLDDGHWVWVTTSSSITTLFYPRTSRTVVKLIHDVIGARRLEVVTTKPDWKTTVDGFVIVLMKDSIELYTWDKKMRTEASLNQMHHVGSLHSNPSDDVTVKNIGLIQVAVTDATLLASLQENVVLLFEVFHDESQLRLLRCGNIPISAATDLESFTINGLTYLILTNGHSTTLWKHRPQENDFALHQRLKTVATSDVHYFRVGYEHFLGVVDESGASIHQWRGALFVRIQVFGGDYRLGRWHGLVYGYETLLTLALPYRLLFASWDKRKEKVFFLKEEHQTTGHHLIVVSFAPVVDDNVLLLLCAADETLVTHELHLSHRPLHQEAAVTSTVTDNVLLKELSYQETFLHDALDRLRKLKTGMLLPEVGTGRETQQQATHVCREVAQKLQTLEYRLSASNESLQGLMQKSMHILKPPGSLSLRSLVASEVVEIEGDVQVASLNAIDVAAFMDDALVDDSMVRGKKTFSGTVVVEQDVTVDRKLNGLSPDAFLRTNTRQEVTGVAKFLAPVTVDGDVVVRGTVNGMDLSEEVILLHSTLPQHMTEAKSFASQVVVSDYVTIAGKLNDVKLPRLAATAALDLGGILKIRGRKSFAKVIVRGDVEATGVNHLDLKRLEAMTVRRDRPATIVAPKIFAEDVAGPAGLTVQTINGLDVRQDLVLRSETKVTLKTHKTFRKQLVVTSGDLYIDGLLDTVNVSDVFLTRGDQRLCGHLTFAGPVFVSDVVRAGSMVVDTAVINGDVHLLHKINGVVLADVLLKDNDELVFHDQIHLTDTQTVDGLVRIRGNINGYNLADDFVHGLHRRPITGTKTFLKPVVIEGNLDVQQKVDGVHLKQLLENVVTTSPESGTVQFGAGRKTFVDGLTVAKELFLPTISISDLASSIQITDLKQLTVRGDFVVAGRVNGQNLDDLNANRMTLTTEQTIAAAPMRTSGNVTIELLEATGSLNGHDIRSLWTDLLWKSSSGKQIVSGTKTFTGRFNVPVIFPTDTVDGLSTDNLRSTVSISDSGVIVSRGPKIHFGTNVVIDSTLRTSGDINGIDLNVLAKNAVRRHHPLPVTGVKVLDELKIKGNLKIMGRLNGLVPGRDILTTNTPQVLTGDVALNGDVTVLDEANVTLTATHVSGGRVAVHELHTGAGGINGIDVVQLARDAVDRSVGPMVVGGTKRLDGTVTFARNLDTPGTINGFNLVGHLRDIVTSGSTNQVVTGKKEFTKDVAVTHGTTRCDGPVLVAGRVETGTSRVFREDVVISGSLTVDGNVTTSAATGNFQNVLWEVDGDIDATWVTGLDLRQLSRDTLTTDGHQIVTGQKKLEGMVKIPSRTGLGSEEHLTRRIDLSAKPLEKSSRTCNLERPVIEPSGPLASLGLVQEEEQILLEDISALALIPTPTSTLLVLAPSGCRDPAQVRLWDAATQKFVRNGTLEVLSVYKMQSLKHCRFALLIIGHRDCLTGNALTSLYVIQGHAFGTRTQLEHKEPAIDWDARFWGEDTLALARLTPQHNLEVEVLTFCQSSASFERLRTIRTSDTKVLAGSVRWIGPSLLLTGGTTETAVWSLNLSTDALRHSHTLMESYLTAWELQDGKQASVATQTTNFLLQVYTLEEGTVSKVEVLDSSLKKARTMDHLYLEEDRRSILVVSDGHWMELFTKQGVSNFMRTAVLPVTPRITNVRLVDTPGQTILVVTSDKRVKVFATPNGTTDCSPSS